MSPSENQALDRFYEASCLAEAGRIIRFRATTDKEKQVALVVTNILESTIVDLIELGIQEWNFIKERNASGTASQPSPGNQAAGSEKASNPLNSQSA